MKDSKLISKFMGYYIYKSNGQDMVRYSDNNYRTLQDTHYHTSWDWLMPVVEECLATDERTEFQHHFINDSLLTCDIEVVYDRVVEFIKDCEEKKVIVKDLHGLDDNTISKIETPMFLIGDWFEDETTFADLRNSKGQVVRIFHERLEDYEKKSLIDSLDS